MAVLAHVGPPRQGKTMFAIAGPVIDALADGQVVCGNVEGWGDPDRVEKLRQLVIKRKGKPADFAIDLRFIPHSVLVSSGNVFPRDMEREDEHGTRVFDDSGSLVPFGALLVWDEAKAFTTDAMHKAAKDIIAYHGHWGTDRHPFNILLIYQHWGGFAPMVRANVEKVAAFRKTAKRSITRWTIDNPGDIPKLPLSKVTTIRDKLTIDAAVGETYKSTRAEVVANDDVKVSFWKTDFAKKKLRLIIILAVVGTIAQVWMVRRFINQNNITLPGGGKSQPAAAGAGGTVQAASSSGPARSWSPGGADDGPVIAGLLPAPGGRGFSVLIRDGERFEVVDGNGFRGDGQALVGPYRGGWVRWGRRY